MKCPNCGNEASQITEMRSGRAVQVCNQCRGEIKPATKSAEPKEPKEAKESREVKEVRETKNKTVTSSKGGIADSNATLSPGPSSGGTGIRSTSK